MLLVGNAGPEMWEAFGRSPEFGTRPDPLNRWSERVIGALAGEFGAGAAYPFGGPPYRPFIRWAQRAEPVHPSVIGPLIHPEFGLWHAYRGALLFAERLALPARAREPRPCDTCRERPCLTACPVDAFHETEGYDVPRCIAHLDAVQGNECLAGGCLARRACPVGADYYYSRPQAEFHMRSFVAGVKARVGR